MATVHVLYPDQEDINRPLLTEGGVSLPEAVDEVVRREQQLSLVEVAERMRAGGNIGQVVLHKLVAETRDKESPVALHQLMGVETDGHISGIWVTEPTEVSRDGRITNIVRLPGLAENIESGVGFAFHRELAKQMPDARIISIGNNGVGRAGSRFKLGQIPYFGIEAMVEQRYEIASSVAQDEQSVLVGTSMGSKIGTEMVLHSLDNGHRLNLAGVCWYAPALVTRDRVASDMFLKFTPKLVMDAAAELTFRTSIRNKLGALGILGASAIEIPRNWRGILASGVQAFDMLSGTALQDVKKVINHAPKAVVIAGEKDPVAELAMWERLAKEHANLTVKVVNGRGHAMTIKPREAAGKVVKTLRQNGIISGSDSRLAS